MAETMRAVRFHDYGGAQQLQVEIIPVPRPGRGEVLIRVHAASVNPIDWKLREGYLRDFVPLRLPVTAGQDIAGTIAATGDDSGSFAVGDRVFAMSATQVLGAYADFIVMAASDITEVPTGLDFVAAAALPMGALTAWQGIVEAGGLKAGDHLFVHAAAGNVGSMAVQIGKAPGAHVTGAAFARDRSLVLSLGADAFVAYDEALFEKTDARFDILFDTLAGEMQARSWSLVRQGGILVSTLGTGDQARAGAAGIRASGMACVPNGGQLQRIAALVEAGRIATRVAETLPLVRAAEAQAMNQTGSVKGKIVLVT